MNKSESEQLNICNTLNWCGAHNFPFYLKCPRYIASIEMHRQNFSSTLLVCIWVLANIRSSAVTSVYLCRRKCICFLCFLCGFFVIITVDVRCCLFVCYGHKQKQLAEVLLCIQIVFSFVIVTGYVIRKRNTEKITMNQRMNCECVEKTKCRGWLFFSRFCPLSLALLLPVGFFLFSFFSFKRMLVNLFE